MEGHSEHRVCVACSRVELSILKLGLGELSTFHLGDHEKEEDLVGEDRG